MRNPYGKVRVDNVHGQGRSLDDIELVIKVEDDDGAMWRGTTPVYFHRGENDALGLEFDATDWECVKETERSKARAIKDAWLDELKNAHALLVRARTAEKTGGDNLATILEQTELLLSGAIDHAMPPHLEFENGEE